MKMIKEAWAKVPTGVKTGLKIVGGVVAVAVVGYAGKNVYNRYNSDGNKEVESVTIEDNDSSVEIDIDEPEVVVTIF